MGIYKVKEHSLGGLLWVSYRLHPLKDFNVNTPLTIPKTGKHSVTNNSKSLICELMEERDSKRNVSVYNLKQSSSSGCERQGKAQAGTEISALPCGMPS